MRKLIITLILIVISQFAFSQRQVYVDGYYRSNGTYVQGYYRTIPNNTVNDNWSTHPNVNPYTGQTGTKYKYNTYPNSYINKSYRYNNYYYKRW